MCQSASNRLAGKVSRNLTPTSMITGAHNSNHARALMTRAQGPRLSAARAWIITILRTYNRQNIIIGNTVWFGKFEQRGVMNIKYCLHSLISTYVDYGTNSGRLYCTRSAVYTAPYATLCLVHLPPCLLHYQCTLHCSKVWLADNMTAPNDSWQQQVLMHI